MKPYTVVVGNIGQVYEGNSPILARCTYREYVELSKAKYGRISQEPVTLFHLHTIEAEYFGALEQTEGV